MINTDSFDSSQSFPFPDAPEPPPGQPILSDTEQRLLTSFFDDVTSHNYNNSTAGEGLNFTDDWLSLPPDFMGTATSFGQPSAPLQPPMHGMPPGGFDELLAPTSAMMAPPPPPPPPATHPSMGQQHSADVLAAATLLRNGSLSQARAGGPSRSFPMRDAGPSMGPPVGHLRHQPMAAFREDGQRLSEPRPPAEHDDRFSGILFGSPANQMSHRVNPPVDVQWGSDSNFGRHFVPQSQKETSEALESERLAYMGCLEVNTSSAGTMRPSTPLRNGDLSPLKLKTRISAQVKDEGDPDAPPRKRQKSKAKDESGEVDDDSSTIASKSARKRRPKAEYMPSTSPSGKDAPGKRRKSGATAASKLPRENLTEEQKRENHIRSEQKRRTLIKEGFDDLCDLVPGLRGGGFSKSTMLSMAAEALDDILKENKQLMDQLAAVQGR